MLSLYDSPAILDTPATSTNHHTAAQLQHRHAGPNKVALPLPLDVMLLVFVLYISAGMMRQGAFHIRRSSKRRHQEEEQ